MKLLRQLFRRLDAGKDALRGPWNRRGQHRLQGMESMEHRRVLSVAPINVGVVYVEQDIGSDLSGDSFDVTFSGGAAGTELDRITIDGDQNIVGFGVGDAFFDINPTGLGADEAYGFEVDQLDGIDSVTASVEDGTTRITLDFNGFEAGDSIRFFIDVDEVEEYDPASTDTDFINDGFDPITSGVEFQGSLFTAHFSAQHFFDVSETAEFRNRYDDALADSGLDLRADNYQGQRDRSAAAFARLQQQPIPAQISGYVYHDRNDNGLREAGEEGIAGVEVQVLPLDTVAPIDPITLTTDANGWYQAENLVAGTYRIVETQQPNGYFDGLDTAGTIDGIAVGTARNDVIDTILLSGGDDGVEYNFGELLPASIRGRVQLSDRDGNCFGEYEDHRPVVGATVLLLGADGQVIDETTTDSNGEYAFTGLMPGTYGVIEITPEGLIDGGSHVGRVDGTTNGLLDANGQISSILIGSGQDGRNYDFCEHEPAKVSGAVYHDANDNGIREDTEIGISGVQVSLYDERGNVVATVTTDANGHYEFCDLTAGRYTVRETQPDGWLDGLDTPGTVGGVQLGSASNPGDVISGIDLGWGDIGQHYNFGERLAASLSGHVFEDLNDNGVRETGEAFISGVSVRLFTAGGIEVATATTDTSGFYQFSNLVAGEYTLRETQPAGYLDGRDIVGTVAGRPVGRIVGTGDEFAGIRLGWGQSGVNYDFGELLPASIRGRVQLSTRDGDCFSESANHRPVVGAVVQLFNANGDLVGQTTTDADGHYAFAGLRPGKYSIVELTPDGLIDGGARPGTVSGRGEGQISSDGRIIDVDLGSGDRGEEYLFCEHEPSSLAGKVYHDANLDGSQGANEVGIEGVVVQLYDQEGRLVAESVTDANGCYKFEGLRAGKYDIVEVHPVGWIDGTDSVGQINGRISGEVDNPGDAIRCIEIGWGEVGDGFDFGELLPGVILGRVHPDIRVDCVFNPEDGEEGIAGVTVELLNEAGDVMLRTITDANGFYRFEGMRPGRYTVRELQPSDYFDGGNNQGSSETNQVSVTVGSGETVRDVNFCEIPPSTLSGYVFQDGATIFLGFQEELPERISEVRDGVRTADDTPLAGVVFELRDGISGRPITSDAALPGIYGEGPIRTTSDAAGFYEFVGLPRGSYAVFQVQPDGFVDGVDSPGSTSGFVFNPGEPINQVVLQSLTVDPQNDAIVRISLPPATDSIENNFSEVIFERETRPLLPPDIPIAPLPPPAELPTVTVPHFEQQIVLEPWRYVSMGDGSDSTQNHTWHLSVIDAGSPRGDGIAVHETPRIWMAHTTHTEASSQKLNEGVWRLAEDFGRSRRASRSLTLGLRGAYPVTGDFDGDGFDELGIFFKGEWFIDINGNGRWDAEDLWARLGSKHDFPVTGDWDGDGKDDIGIYGRAWPGDPAP